MKAKQLKRMVCSVLILCFAMFFMSGCIDKFPLTSLDDGSSMFNIDKVSRGETGYNVNGGEVTVNILTRHAGELYFNPTFSQAELLNNAIKYKKKFPGEDVNIEIASFHFSIVAAACIDESKSDYGLMKSLYDLEFDDNGFIRVSYLLILAAKSGINVKVLGQLDASPVVQLDENNQPYSRPDINFETYFRSHENDDCDENVGNFKVKDFLKFVRTGWTSYGDRSASDMMHLKFTSVSHLIDRRGLIQKNAIWLASQNLDGIKYSGSNGNDGLQTGAIIVGHQQMYQCAVNFFNLAFKYSGQEDVYEFRNIVKNRNIEEHNLILGGRAHEIKQEEQILYLGTEKDDVFELYFTPLGASAGGFDKEFNPYAKYTTKLLNSEGAIYFGYLGTKFNECSFTNVWSDVINEAFVKANNKGSKIFMHGGVSEDDFSAIKTGKNASFKYIGSKFGYFHSKDVYTSWVEDSIRKYALVLASTNMHEGSLGYQANSMLIIKENSNMKNKTAFEIYTKTNNFGMF